MTQPEPSDSRKVHLVWGRRLDTMCGLQPRGLKTVRSVDDFVEVTRRCKRCERSVRASYLVDL